MCLLAAALLLFFGVPAHGGTVSLGKTTPMKSCPFSTLSAAKTLDRTQTILEPGFRSVDVSQLKPLRTGRITAVSVGTVTTDAGDTKPVLIKKVTAAQRALVPNADPIAHEFQVLKDLHESSEQSTKYFPRAVALAPDFLAIEYFESKTLAQIFKEHSMTTARAENFRRQLSDAVDILNAAGVSHGDINPTNILILGDDSIKLVDFGIAVRTGENHVSIGSHGFNSRAQRALGSAQGSEASRAYPVLDNADGLEGVFRTIMLNVQDAKTYTDDPTSHYSGNSGN